MDPVWMIGLDLVAIVVMAYGLYFRRHRRRDLMAAYVGINLGVLAVTMVLADSTASIGLGLGLFGVLSIIRLRSTEISQTEVAYYFASLAIALVAGLGGGVPLIAIGLIVLVIGALAVVDHPGLLASHRQQTVRLDRAIVDHDELVTALEDLTGGRIRQATVLEVDLVNDSALVDVRWSAQSARRRATVAA